MMILRRNIFFCDFCDFCVTIILDIAAQYRFRMFSPFRTFSHSLSYAEMILTAKILSRTENTENTEIISFEHGWNGFHSSFACFTFSTFRGER